jgi:Transposase DDE domain
MATSIPEVAQALGSVFSTTSDAAARENGFVKRQSKLSGSAFVQTVTFGWLANPRATLEELSQTASMLGVRITPQGLDQRFTPQAAACLREVLEAAVTRVLAANPVAIPVLQCFAGGVFLLDSTTITLPDALAQLWPGSGRNAGPGPAALKLHVRFDLLHGALAGPLFQPGRYNDHEAVLPGEPLPSGALHLADLGYFDLDYFASLSENQAYWLTRVQTNTRLHDEEGRVWTLPEFIAAQGGQRIDLPIRLGLHHRLRARLVAVRVPAAVAAQRRARMLRKARRRNKKIDRGRWALAEWTVYATNIPAALLSLEQILTLARCRWQIELLFKLWKSEGQIDESRSEKPWRILCEVYGKLLGMVVQHWILLISCWTYANRSLVKASRTVRSHALSLAAVLHQGQLVCKVLAIIQRCLASGCRINKRRKEPATYQSLLE